MEQVVPAHPGETIGSRPVSLRSLGIANELRKLLQKPLLPTNALAAVDPLYRPPLGEKSASYHHQSGIEVGAVHSTYSAPARDDAAHLAQAILDAKEKLGLCRVFNNISDRDLCLYFRRPPRSRHRLRGGRAAQFRLDIARILHSE
jgi:hypothetical protein